MITLLEAENKYDRSSNLNFILLLFIPKKYFLTEPQKYWEKSCLESFIQGEANDSFVAKTYVNAINFFFFFDVEVSLNDYSSPLHMQNKTSFRTTLVQLFSFDLFGGTAKPQNRWGK